MLLDTRDAVCGLDVATPGVRAEMAPHRLDRLIWTLVLAIACIVVIAPAVTGFSVVWPSFLAPIAASVTLIAGSWFYRRHRPDRGIASALESTAQIIAFAAAGAPLSYLAASFDFPLQDHLFDALDRALGLDWKALLAWMNTHPAPCSLLNAAYLSFTPQATTTVLALAFTARFIHLRVFVLAFILTALVTIAISALLPAAGAWPHYGLVPADSPNVMPAVSGSWPVFYGLRDGTARLLLGAGSEGIISFPSLHAALGVIFILALWPIAVLRWIGLMVNALMIVATPIEGSHFFVDVAAGIVIAFACWAWARRLAERTHQSERAPAGYARLVPGE